MDSYTITITPNDQSGNSTTLVVDTSSDQVRITDVHLHSADGLTGGLMPSVDFDFLLRAVEGPSINRAAVTSAPPHVTALSAHATPEADARRAATAEAPARAVEEASPYPVEEPAAVLTAARATTPAAAAPDAPLDTDGDLAPEPARNAPSPRKRSSPRRGAEAGDAENTTTTAASRAGGRTPASARRKATTPSATAAGGTERAYRRMPEDFAEVYRQASTAAAIVDHYGVPRHTAQGWIRRLKALEVASQT